MIHLIVLIAGASHTGKTLLAQRLLEKYHFPYLSIDHLKMGLIRSGNTDLTPMDDDKLTDYLWPIVREMIKTAVENGQNLIVEGCYIPPDWQRDFDDAYLAHIKCFCIVMTDGYIRSHFPDIRKFSCVMEKRLNDDDLTVQSLLADNQRVLNLAQRDRTEMIVIDDDYANDIELQLRMEETE